MELKIQGVVQDGPEGTLVVDFRATPKAAEVAAFLHENLGREVEVTLTAPEKTAGASVHVGRRKAPDPLKREDLSPCASGAYWKTKNDKGK